MSLTSAEFSAMYNAFVVLSNKVQGKSNTKKFLKAVQREFGYSDVVEFRKNHCVVIETATCQKIFAYAHSSDRFYHLDKCDRPAS